MSRMYLALFVASTMFLASSSGESPEKKATFEYKVVDRTKAGPDFHQAFETQEDRDAAIKAWGALGDEGWELIASITDPPIVGGSGMQVHSKPYRDFFRRYTDAASRNRWEYKVEKLGEGVMADRLSKMNSDGWDLATVVSAREKPIGINFDRFYVFKRVKK
jgi:hypothetical protein